ASISLPSVARPSSASLDPWLCVPASRRVCPCREGVFPVDEGLVHGGCQAPVPPVRGISNSRNCGDSTDRVNTFGGFARNGRMTCSVRFDSDRAHSGIENDQERRFLGRLRLLSG